MVAAATRTRREADPLATRFMRLANTRSSLVMDDSGPAKKPRRKPWRNSGHDQDQVHRDRRAALLRRATLAFRNWNYHEITMAQIAEDIGVSKPTLYNYVKGKQEILYEGHKLSMDFADQALAEARAAGGTAAHRIGVFCKTYCALLADGRGGAAITLFLEALPDEERREIERRRRAHRLWLERLIAEGVSDGSLRAVDPTIATYFFLGAVNWLMKWYRPDKSIDSAAIGMQFASMFLHGIAHPADPQDPQS
jgi:AcrR family transcriptional regulator